MSNPSGIPLAGVPEADHPVLLGPAHRLEIEVDTIAFEANEDGSICGYGLGAAGIAAWKKPQPGAISRFARHGPTLY